MATFKERFIKYRKANLITLFISIVIGTGIFLLFYFTQGGNLYASVNAALITAGILLGVGGLIWVTFQGLFDMVSYGFRQLGHSMFNRHNPAKYDDFPDYKHQMNVKRSDTPDIYLPILVVGVAYLIATIVFRIIMAGTMGY